MRASSQLADAIDAVLPQTQCTRCGFPNCRSYAEAIAEHSAPINRCPPGGAQGIAKLAELTGLPVEPLDPAHGKEAPRSVALIDEAWCIGCTLCLKACPVDCIVGGSKQMHTVDEDNCTGCELCIPVCPVDCIALVSISGERTGWDAWSAEAAQTAREAYIFHRERLDREREEHEEWLAGKASSALADLPGTSPVTDPPDPETKRAVLEAALARMRARRAPPR